MIKNFDYYGSSAYFMGNIMKKLEEVYMKYGYNSLYTPTLERIDEKSKSNAFNVMDNYGNEYSLKYDSTLSLRRVVSSHEDISFPYKRYQIQKSFRNVDDNELCEFYQCDADIIGSKSNSSDAEIIQMACDGIENVGINNYSLRINHKAIINAINSNKINIDSFKERLDGNIISDISILKEINNEDFITGLNEVESICSNLPENILKKCKLDFEVKENSDYYTGMIFEGTANLDEPKTILHGGRYDNLVENYKKEVLPSVGMAFVLENLLDVLRITGKNKNCNANRIIFYLQDENISIRNDAISRLREKYQVLTIDKNDLSQKEFVNYCKENNARLIAVINKNNLELYRIDEYELKNSKKLVLKSKGGQNE